MKCGNCQNYGVTVEHVRSCYRGQTVQAAVKSVVDKHVAPVSITVEPAHPVTEPGIYFKDGDYYKVVPNQAGTRLYAKVWNGHEWVYDSGAIYNLYAEQRVTAEQAARFGKVTGACVFCSRLLTDERSVSAGYGPVCAEREGLPWGA